MENLKTTEFQISLEAPSSDSWEKPGMKWHSVTAGGNWSAPFHHRSGVNKAQNSPWNLLMQEGSSTSGVFWKVKELSVFWEMGREILLGAWEDASLF